MQATCPHCGKTTRLVEVGSEETQRETLALQSPSVETSMDSSMLDDGASSSTGRPSIGTTSLRDDPLSRSFGRFQLNRKLGRGGFGEVWEALDSHLGRKVAIKLPIFPLSDQRRSRRFLTEAQAAARLAHPNIVAVYDAGIIESQHYLAIEYVDGKPLDSVVGETPLSQLEAVQVVIRLAQALGYAHDRSIVHRDIKPQNIVLDSDGLPKIVDFGLAKLLEQGSGQTIDGTVMGTPAYMAPEQAKGEVNRIGPHTDQYSLGAVLYWLIAGRTPFAGPRIAIITQVISSEPEKPTSVNVDVDPRLEAICLKAMSKQPEDRYKSCHDFAEDLRRFCENEDPLARPPSLWKRMSRTILGNPREAIVGGLAAVLFIVVLSASILGYQNASRLAATAIDARREASDELAKQKELELQLANQLIEVEKAKQVAIRAKEFSETKRNELVAANEGFQSIENANQALGATKNEQLGQLTKAKEQQGFLARESMRIEFEANPEAGLLRIQKAILNNSWNEAKEMLQLFPASKRWLPWKMLAHFTVQREVSLAFDRKGKRLAIPIIFFRWDSKNELLRLGTGMGKFELIDCESMETLEYFVNGLIQSEADFLFDKATKRLTVSERYVVNGVSTTIKKQESVSRFGFLLAEGGTENAIGIGLEAENGRTKNSKLCIAKLVNKEWNELWSKSLKGRDWESKHLRSDGSIHIFRLSRPKSSALPSMNVIAKLDLSVVDAPQVVFSADDGKSIDSSQDKADLYWEDKLLEAVGVAVNNSKEKKSDATKDWKLNASLIEFEPVLPVPVTGISMQSFKDIGTPRFAFDRNDRIFFAFGLELAVCRLKFEELLHE